MDISNSAAQNLLDKIRQTEGMEALKTFFFNIFKDDRNTAASLINDESLSFSTLFALKSDIKANGFYNALNHRNKTALDILDKMLSKSYSTTRSASSESRHGDYDILRWVLETGSQDDGLDEQHQEVLDTTALLLIKSYKEKAVLPLIVDLIFNRHLNGQFTYDLVWAAFEARSPQVLVLIANRLLSPRQEDFELASRLLKFIPCIQAYYGDKSHLYSNCVNWIYENYPFIYFTGEGLHQSCSPVPCEVSLEAKYLYKTVSPEDGKILSPLSNDEHNALRNFNQLDTTAKVLLSKCSVFIHKLNIYQWHAWLLLPIHQQVNYAKRIGGWLI